MRWKAITPNPKSYPQRTPDRIDENGRTWASTGCPVIVTTADGKVFACNYQWSCLEQGIGTFWHRRSDNEIKNVIAWMPMPEPYQPKDERPRVIEHPRKLTGSQLRTAMKYFDLLPMSDRKRLLSEMSRRKGKELKAATNRQESLPESTQAGP